MNTENSKERPVREIRDLTFFFPNETPIEDAIATMQRIIDFRFEMADFRLTAFQSAI